MIIERSTGLVVDRLLAAGDPVVPVHPTAVHAARPRWGAAGAKTDLVTATSWLDYLRTDGHRLRRLQPLDPGLRELQALVRLREDHVRARTAASNQLGALLDAYWRAQGHVLQAGQRHRAGLPDRLSNPTGSRPARPSPPGRVLPPPCLPGRQATRRTPGPAAGSTDPIQRAGACGARPVDHRPGPAAAGLQATIGELETAIKQRVAQHPRASCCAGCPGSAPSTWPNCWPRSVPSLTVSAPPSRPPPNAARCQSPGPQARPAGSTSAGPLTPGPHRPHRLRPQRSDAVTLGRPLYADARARGKRNPHATRIVARAWLRVIWACWHTGTPYDPRPPRRAAPRSRLT